MTENRVPGTTPPRQETKPQGSSEKSSARPRKLTHEELQGLVMREYDESELVYNHHGIVRSSLDYHTIKSFVEEDITGVRINGVNVICVDDVPSVEGESNYLNRTTQRLIKSKKTKLVLAEYFEPDFSLSVRTFKAFKRNLRKAVIKVVNSFVRSGEEYFYDDDQSSIDERTIADRFTSGRVVAEACKEADKPVAVADIANKPSLFVAALTSLRTAELAAIGAIYPPYSLLAGLAAMVYGYHIHRGRQSINRGVINTEQTYKIERFLLDYDIARRLYLTKAIQQITQQYKLESEHPESDMFNPDDPQIVVIYPQAHTDRVIKKLITQGKVAAVEDRVKSGIYKAFAPYLRFSVRIYNAENGKWKRISRERIRMSGRSRIQP